MNDDLVINRETAEKIRQYYVSQEWDYEKTAEIFNVPVDEVKKLCVYGDDWKGYEAYKVI